MAGPYRHEPLIPASLKSATANLAILRTQALVEERSLTPGQSMAALIAAGELERIVQLYSTRRTSGIADRG